jgi:hypothetical protein
MTNARYFAWLRRSALLFLFIGFGASGCAIVDRAAFPVSAAVKTTEELLGKLRKGLDENALGSPEFYPLQIGYAIPSFPDPKSIQDFVLGKWIRVQMQEGEFKGWWFVVATQLIDNKRVIIADFATPGCVRFTRLLEIFPDDQFVSKEDTALFRHRASGPLRFYQLQRSRGNEQELLSFALDSNSGCLISVTANQIYE